MFILRALYLPGRGKLIQTIFDKNFIFLTTRGKVIHLLNNRVLNDRQQEHGLVNLTPKKNGTVKEGSRYQK
jgi:hypothetical protein